MTDKEVSVYIITTVDVFGVFTAWKLITDNISHAYPLLVFFFFFLKIKNFEPLAKNYVLRRN